MNKKFFLTGFVVGVVLAVGALLLIARHFMIQPDISLKNMKLESLDGSMINNSELVGKPLVINYWATWCAPCRQEFPVIEKVKKQFEGQINFITISDESRQTINDFKDKNPYTFTFLRSSEKLNNLTLRPITYFYNRKGELLLKHEGGISEKELLESIDKIQ